MERFLVLVVKDTLSLEEQDAFLNCIKVCHPCKEEKNYCNVFAPHIAPFMEKLSLNLAVIRTFQYQNPKDVAWDKVELNDENIHELLSSGILQKESTYSPIAHNVFPSEDETYLSEVLHSLADQLPVDGTFSCDIIISQRVLEGKVLRDHVRFAAALYRFRFWHNAKITVVRKSDQYGDDFLDWYESIDSHVITASSISTGGTILWRGGIQIGSSDASVSTYIHGFQLELQTMSDIQTWSYVMDAASVVPASPSNKGALIVSSKLEVLDQCDLSTIPPHVMTPLVFHLSLSPCYNANEEACQFLQFVKKRPQAAFILRLQYSQITSLPQKKTKTSDKWDEFSSCTEIHLYDPVLPLPTQHLNFVLTSASGDCSDMQSAVAYLMRGVDDMKSDFYHNIEVSDLCHSNVDVRKSQQEEEVSNVLSCSQCLNVPLYTFMNFINKTQLNVLSAWQVHKKSTWPEDGSITLEEVRDIFSSVQDAVSSTFLQSSCLGETKSYSDDVFYEPVDLSSCSEKTFLMQQQILKIKNKEYNSSDTLGGIPPPTAQKSPITIPASDVMDYFTPAGEARNPGSDKIEVPRKMKNKIMSYSSIKQASCLNWPDVLHLRWHDVYYNYSNCCEDQEDACNKIAGCCIINETATTCNHSLSLNIPLLAANKDMSSKESSLPQTRKYSSWEDVFLNQKDCKFVKGKLCLRNGLTSSSSTEELLQITDAPNRNNFRCLPSPNSNISLRRSPRKLVRVNYKQSQSHTKTRRSEPIKPHVTSDELSEKNKMKLRDAVAVALEQHGIGLDHPSFKPCGRKLFAVCKAFVKDVMGKGSISAEMKKIAQAHAKQVVEFEMQKIT